MIDFSVVAQPFPDREEADWNNRLFTEPVTLEVLTATKR
jgi:hypothetical protein